MLIVHMDFRCTLNLEDEMVWKWIVHPTFSVIYFEGFWSTRALDIQFAFQDFVSPLKLYLPLF